MTFWRILLAVLFTLLLLAFTRKTTAVRSVHKTVEQHGIRIEHTTVPKQVGDELPVVSAKVEGSSDVKLFYRIGEDGSYQSLQMIPESGGGDIFTASIPLHPKGQVAWYYLEAVVQREGDEIRPTLPETEAGRVKAIRLKFEGEVPAYIVIPHVLCIFGAIFFAVLALFSVIDIKKGKRTLKQSVKFPLLTFVLLFLGFVPFGIAMNYFAFGVFWEAFPFGWDITDNKSQIMLLFWLVTLLLVKGTVGGKADDRNLVSDGTYSALVIVSFLATMLILAIPHSL
jgi:hypothetical protein